jgi:uncharacterized integral membrane protein (TIGR00698 family)
MSAKEKGTGISAAWRKDDWMSVWIGFIILAFVFILLIPRGTLTQPVLQFKTPGWRWMPSGAFLQRTAGLAGKADSFAREAEGKGDAAVAAQASSLKSALDSGDRKGIVDAAGALAQAGKDAADQDIGKKADKLAADIKRDAGATVGSIFVGKNLRNLLYLFIGFLILGVIGESLMGLKIGNFILAFPIVFILSAIAFFVAGNTVISHYGLEVVFWSLIIGLFISNVFGVPEWLKHAVKTEFFIKIGIVLLGAEVLFSTIMKLGAYGIVQAIVVILAVFYVCFFVAKKLGLDDEFASILGTGVSICGVSAAIAAGGAIKGDPKKVSHTISLVLLCAIPMLIFEPIIARVTGMQPAVAGAWIGGTIDTTGAVVAAGSIAGGNAMQAAVVVKMTQNVFIGLAAFLLALWFVFKKKASGEKPRGREIWFRFPKFVIGFVIASLVVSLLMAEPTAKAVTGLSGPIRGWWFTMAFLCIGLDTRFKDLLAMGRGKPAGAFLIAQAFNIGWTLLIAYLLFGGVLFSIPKF